MKLLRWLFGNKPPKKAMNLGRNEPCWCGSGKKYKRCHYESDQAHFAAQRAPTCAGPT